MKILHILLLALVLAVANSSNALSVTNGNFSAGLDGWTVDAFDFFGTINPDPFASIGFEGSNSYLHLSTGLLVQGLFVLSVEQDVQITAQSTILGLDIKSFLPTDDVSDNGMSFITDGVFINVVASNGNITTVGFADARGPFLGDIGTDLLDPTDAFFDIRLIADLSVFINQTVSLQLAVVPNQDGFVSAFAIDNISLTPVPLPSAIWLFLAALGCFKLARRRNS